MNEGKINFGMLLVREIRTELDDRKAQRAQRFSSNKPAPAVEMEPIPSFTGAKVNGFMIVSEVPVR